MNSDGRTMRLTLEEVEDISRRTASTYAADLTLVGVAATDGGADHVELLVTVSGCHAEPCMLMLNVVRTDRESLERDLTAGLREAVARHRTQTAKA